MLAIIVCLCTPICGQEQPPQLLIGAAQCLMAKQFLPRPKVKTQSLGFVVDERSYPGQRVLYLVDYAGPSRSDGLVFAVFLSEHSGHQTFDIQNNATFVLSRKDPEGVLFTGEALGGIWTHERLISAIKQIEKLPRYTVSTQDLVSTSPTKGCEAYTDPFHRH
jgi:hypothetical protein